MKCLAVSLALLAACAPFALADDAAKNAKIEELLALTHSDRMMSQTFDQVRAATLAQVDKLNVAPDQRRTVQQAEEQMLGILQDAMRWDKIKPSIVKVYSETLSEEELDGILNFYRSPAGQALLEKMPMLMQRSMGVAQQVIAEVMPRIEKMTEDLKQKSEQQGGNAPGHP